MFSQLTSTDDQPFIISEMKGYPTELDNLQSSVHSAAAILEWTRHNPKDIFSVCLCFRDHYIAAASQGDCHESWRMSEPEKGRIPHNANGDEGAL